MKMEGQIRLVNVENIIPNRFQPRLEFDQVALQELADSIKEHGVIEPVVLRRIGEKFEIIAGERRYKASIIAGLSAIPSIICDLDDNESAEVAIVENTHRRPLSAIEEAKSFQKLLERRYVTQDQLAKRLGTSQSNIANKIRLLSLDENVQDALLKNRISERHARSLLRVTDKFKQVDLLNLIINEKWSVKRLDEEIDKIIGTYTKESTTGSIKSNSRIDINVDDIINNSEDLLTDYEETNDVANYEYQGRVEEKVNKKKSLFFNDLENEAANMDSSFGFNPFKKEVIPKPIERDYELLELTDDDEIVDAEIEETEDENVQVRTKEVIKEVYIEREYKTVEEVREGLSKMIISAKKNGIALEVEDFDFDLYYQCIIRIKPDDEK